MEITFKLDTEYEDDKKVMAAIATVLGVKGPTVLTPPDAAATSPTGPGKIVTDEERRTIEELDKQTPAPGEVLVVDEDGGVIDEPTETDVTGRPWDERIHATNKSKNADGTWRKRRGVDKDLYEKINAEIAPAAVVPSDVTTSPEQPEFDTSVFTSGSPPPTAPPAETSSIQWPNLLQRVMTAQQAGNFDEARSKAFLEGNGIQALPLLATRSDLFGTYLEYMGI